MVGVIIIIMVVFDAQAAVRAIRGALVRPARSRARVIASAYSSGAAADATTKGRTIARPALSRVRFPIGAGEEIRTLDPNLGKVVLYH